MIVDRLFSFGNIDIPKNGNERAEYNAFNNLKSHLMDISGLLYFKPIIWVNNKFIKPDIIFFHPIMGILVIEVKAWDKNFIENLKYDVNGKLISKNYVNNPLYQVENYKELISDTLRKNGIELPCVSLLYFPNLTKKEYELLNNDIFKYFCRDSNSIFKRDRIKEKVLNVLSNYNRKAKNLSINEFKIIRKLLFPFLEIDGFRVNSEILDLYQESFLYSFDKGYRILRGVAGSGKTTVLISKAIYEKLKDKKKQILITTFTNALVSNIKNNIKGIIQKRNLPLSIDDFEIETINSIKLDKKRDVIICDECQDFLKEDFSKIKTILKNDGMVFFGVDETQRIYENRDWKWIDVGFDARGKVSILKISYRNPSNISLFAKKFLFEDKKLIEELKELDFPLEETITIKEGEKIDFFITYKIDQIVKELLKQYKPSDILILTPFKKKVDDIIKSLKSYTDCYGFTSDSLKEDKKILDDKLLVMTYHSSKGLEREVVIVTDINSLPYKNSDRVSLKRKDRKLSYVAFTRARRKLIITASKLENFAIDVKNILKGEKNDNN